MKKIISLIAVFAVVFGLLAVFSAQACETPTPTPPCPTPTCPPNPCCSYNPCPTYSCNYCPITPGCGNNWTQNLKQSLKAKTQAYLDYYHSKYNWLH